MNHIRTYRLFIVFIMVIFPIPACSQSEKVDVEIHIADKDAYIYLDGSTNSIGHGRTLYNIQLTQGKHTVTATRPSYTKVSKTVTVSKSNYASRIIKLSSPQPIYGHIFVVSSPGPIEIELDGKKTGKYTPHLFDSILIGSHSVMLKYDGYESERRTFNVKESDTIRIDMALAKIPEREQAQYTSTYSNYNSGYSSSRSSYGSSSNSGYSSSSYSTYRSWRVQEEEEYSNKHFDVYYFGIGTGLLLNWELQWSLFDFRYKWFEIRPCLWGINFPFMQNISHTKLPPIIVDPSSYSSYFNEYSIRKPERSMQIFYAPMVRFHIPIKKNKALVLGAGPQISWTKFEWHYDRDKLSNLSNYVMSSEDIPYRQYLKDDIWFTAEIAFLWYFTKGSDISLYARYQDGFYIGFEYRFGRKY